jgi:F-type H+-transporting ATPase subunit b
MKRISLGLGACSGLLALAGPVLAEEGGKAPLPQLDAAQFPGLLFWLVITFPLLFALMRFLAVPNVQGAQADRQKILRTDLEAAEADNEQSRALQEAYEKAMAEARVGAQETVSGMLTAAAAEEAKQRSAQQQKLGQRLVEAEGRIAGFRETALKEGRKAAADLAEAIMVKLIGSATGKKTS